MTDVISELVHSIAGFIEAALTPTAQDVPTPSQLEAGTRQRASETCNRCKTNKHRRGLTLPSTSNTALPTSYEDSEVNELEQVEEEEGTDPFGLMFSRMDRASSPKILDEQKDAPIDVILAQAKHLLKEQDNNSDPFPFRRSKVVKPYTAANFASFVDPTASESTGPSLQSAGDTHSIASWGRLEI